MVGLCNFCLFLQEWRFGRSRSSKVIDYGTNRKHVCDFLLVRHSNLAPISHRFGDVAGFLCSWPHPYSTLIFWGYSRWIRSPMLGSMWAGIRPLTYVRSILTCVKIIPQLHGQTGRRTDDILSHNRAGRAHRAVKSNGSPVLDRGVRARTILVCTL